MMKLAEKSYEGKTVKVFIESKLIKKKMQNRFLIEFTRKNGQVEIYEASETNGVLRLASKILGIEVKKGDTK